jgi:hypothetical protein
VNEKITTVRIIKKTEKNRCFLPKNGSKKMAVNLLKRSGSRHVKGPALLLALITY